ncbi:MAG: hypothetical protein INR63_21250 [Actinomycetospora chiangmaiensis]|nr:hypothetical protein [Actinomycetospora chiangmaiensis]
MVDVASGDAPAQRLDPTFRSATLPAPGTGGTHVRAAAIGNPGGLAVLILHLWRFLGPGSMDDGIRARLREALAAAARGWSGDWGDTMRSAIGRGGPLAPSVEFLHDGNLDSRRGDEIMSALALRGLEGDCEASAVLAHGLAILAHGHHAALSLMELSDEWSSLASRQREAIAAGRD